MKLREYIFHRSEPNSGLGKSNPILRRIALRAGVSIETVHSISLGRRSASPQVAERISKATDGYVAKGELINEAPKRRGPKRAA